MTAAMRVGFEVEERRAFLRRSSFTKRARVYRVKVTRLVGSEADQPWMPESRARRTLPIQ